MQYVSDKSQDTLMARLTIFDNLANSVRKFRDIYGIGLSERELRDARKGVIDKLYDLDQLASKVSKGEKAYTRLIIPIQERYDTFLSRILPPRIDKNFDDGANTVLSSMNNVGYGNINPAEFTTSERRKRIWRRYAIELGGISLLSGVMYFSLVMGSPEKSGLAFSFSAMLAAGLLYGDLASVSSSMKEMLDNLRTAAQGTEEFLRGDCLDNVIINTG